jgi:hypothetical protein
VGHAARRCSASLIDPPVYRRSTFTCPYPPTQKSENNFCASAVMAARSGESSSGKWSKLLVSAGPDTSAVRGAGALPSSSVAAWRPHYVACQSSRHPVDWTGERVHTSSRLPSGALIAA